MHADKYNLCVLASAGARKTEFIVEKALTVTRGNVLVLTYTENGQQEIFDRFCSKAGTVPTNIRILGWFSFLINECVKPYQSAVTQSPFVVRGLNFLVNKKPYAKRPRYEYYIDNNGDIYRDVVSDLTFHLNHTTHGLVIKRLESIYSHIFIDEVQDFAGYDLEVLDILINSSISLIMVGDPRQHIYSTNTNAKHGKYSGAGLIKWLQDRKDLCAIEYREDNYRCNRLICEFANSIFPNLPRMNSCFDVATDHDGIFQVHRNDIYEYINTYNNCVLLKHSAAFDTCNLDAINIGITKGRTYDRIAVFPTVPMISFLENRDSSMLTSPERLYVAVTRARHSVAFIVPSFLECDIPVYRGTFAKRRCQKSLF